MPQWLAALSSRLAHFWTMAAEIRGDGEKLLAYFTDAGFLGGRDKKLVHV